MTSRGFSVRKDAFVGCQYGTTVRLPVLVANTRSLSSCSSFSLRYVCSLDALERLEESRLETLRAAVLPEAPDPIGVAGSTDKMKQEVAPILNAAGDALDLVGPSTFTTSFWHKYRQQFHDLQRDNNASSPPNQQDGTISAVGGEHRHSEQPSTGGRLSTGSSMSINSSRSSIAYTNMDALHPLPSISGDGIADHFRREM